MPLPPDVDDLRRGDPEPGRDLCRSDKLVNVEPTAHCPDPTRPVLPTEVRTLSVLRHVAAAIPAGDRWYRVFRRYVGKIEERVEGLGGEPDDVAPSPDGTGKPIPADDGARCPERWVVAAVVALVAVAIALAPTAWAAAAAAVGAALIVAALCSWSFGAGRSGAIC